MGIGHDSVAGDKYFFTMPGVAGDCTLSYYLWAEDSFCVVNGIDIWATDPEAAPQNNVISFVVSTVGVEETMHLERSALSLSVQPNPFTDGVRITASVGDAREGFVRIFDQSGRQVAKLDVGRGDGHSNSSAVSLSWKGLDESGRSVPSGTYFAVLQTGSEMQRKHVAKLIKLE
jgi:hypothetical protein